MHGVPAGEEGLGFRHVNVLSEKLPVGAPPQSRPDGWVAASTLRFVHEPGYSVHPSPSHPPTPRHCIWPRQLLLSLFPVTPALVSESILSSPDHGHTWVLRMFHVLATCTEPILNIPCQIAM